jgi:transcriptional regulator with PAS, ATPase and Fis domain
MIATNPLKEFRSSFELISLLTGEDFLKNLVSSMSAALEVDGVWVTEFHKGQNAMTTLVFWHSGNYQKNFTYLIDGTPCEALIQSTTVVHYVEKMQELLPQGNKIINKFKGESYIGASLRDDDGEVIGSVAILDSKPLALTDEIATIVNVIKSRTQAEVLRLRRERESLNRETQLNGLLNGIPDLLININEKGQIVMANSIAEAMLGLDGTETGSRHISQVLSDSSKSKLLTLIENMNDRSSNVRYLWIPGTLEVRPKSANDFEAVGTLSRYDLDDRIYYTLVLRIRDDKEEAGDKVKQLIDETECLREELEDIKHSHQLIGESEPVKQLLQNIYMVAYTGTTVLITGETGTGKELVARHIHQTSNRRHKPMITVNCGAIPASLMESELFGHAKGAFTGASAERKGRFQLADGGTIFLDEIGELPLDLQVKLLRVIQESEFEPVGSSKTIKVDVRIIAATHRNLPALCTENKFREDLYYRLNVFPLEVPPLRERHNDVVLIGNAFIRNFSKRLNKTLLPLTVQQEKLLKSYSWPGNIRELQNVIERAAIMTHDGVLNLDAKLGFATRKSADHVQEENERILTKEEFLEFEKRNIVKALKASNWRVSGKNGAAALLHMVPSTLSSRIIALGIKIPKS